MPPCSAPGSSASPTPMHAGLQHQPDRLAHRHEVALHVGMGDRQRAAALQLALEQRHDRAGGAQHVAEPHGDAAHAVAGGARPKYPVPGNTFPPAASTRPSRWWGSPPCRWRSAPSPAHRPRARRRPRGGCRRRWSAAPPAGWTRRSARASARRRGTPVRGGTSRTPRGRGPRRGCRRSAPGGAPAGGSRPARCRSATARIRRCRAGSASPGRTPRPGGRVREPIVPPAPVTMTRRPWISRAMPSRSSGTCGAVQQVVDHHRAQLQPRGGRAGGAERGGARRAAQRQAEAVGLVDQARQRRPAQVGRGDDDGGGQPVLGGQAVEHGRHVVDAAQDGLALDAPAALAGADGDQAGDREALAAVLGEGAQQQVQVLRRADQQQGRRRRAPRARARGGGAGAGDTARGACRAGPAASAHGPPGRRGWAGRCRSAPAGRRTAPRRAPRRRRRRAGPTGRGSASIAATGATARRPAAARRRRRGWPRAG